MASSPPTETVMEELISFCTREVVASQVFGHLLCSEQMNGEGRLAGR